VNRALNLHHLRATVAPDAKRCIIVVYLRDVVNLSQYSETLSSMNLTLDLQPPFLTERRDLHTVEIITHANVGRCCSSLASQMPTFQHGSNELS
jgi:hypothetical protein